MKTQISKEYLNLTLSFIEYFNFILGECMSFNPIHVTISVEDSLMFSLSLLINNGFPNLVLRVYELYKRGFSVTC
jgi:hypothetical protein